MLRVERGPIYSTVVMVSIYTCICVDIVVVFEIHSLFNVSLILLFAYVVHVFTPQ